MKLHTEIRDDDDILVGTIDALEQHDGTEWRIVATDWSLPDEVVHSAVIPRNAGTDKPFDVIRAGLMKIKIDASLALVRKSAIEAGENMRRGLEAFRNTQQQEDTPS